MKDLRDLNDFKIHDVKPVRSTDQFQIDKLGMRYKSFNYSAPTQLVSPYWYFAQIDRNRVTIFLDGGSLALSRVRDYLPRHALRGVFKSQFSNIFQETGALPGQKLTKAHQWLKERT